MWFGYGADVPPAGVVVVHRAARAVADVVRRSPCSSNRPGEPATRRGSGCSPTPTPSARWPRSASSRRSGRGCSTGELWVRVAIGVCAGIDVVVALKASSTTGWLALVRRRRRIRRAAARPRARHPRDAGEAGAGRRGRPSSGSPSCRFRGWSVSPPTSSGGTTRAPDAGRSGTSSVDSVEDRWLVGFGWFSFWDDPANRAELFERTGQQFDSAHSSFMETLLYLGGVGVVLLLAVVVFGFGRTWWEALGGTSWAMAWWAAVGMFAFIENVAESRIAFHSIFWLLLVAPGFAATRYGEVSPSSSAKRATPRAPALRVVHLPVATAGRSSPMADRRRFTLRGGEHTDARQAEGDPHAAGRSDRRNRVRPADGRHPDPRRTSPSRKIADAPGDWVDRRIRRRAVVIALNLLPFAGIAFLWFIGVIRDRIGENEDRFFATVFLGSGLLFVGDAVLFRRRGRRTTRVAGQLEQLRPTDAVWSYGRRVTGSLLSVYAMRMSAVFMISTTTSTVRTQTRAEVDRVVRVHRRRGDAADNGLDRGVGPHLPDLGAVP